MDEKPVNFMWRRQSDFLTHVEFGFEGILEELKCKLDHFHFIVGFDTYDLANSAVVRVDPQADEIPLEEMEEMFAEIKAGYSPYPDDDMDEEEWKEAFGKHRDFTWELERGIYDVLKKDDCLAHLMPFCSTPYKVGNHLISLVMLVSREDYDAQPHLDLGVSRVEHGVWPSFLFAIVETFIHEYAEQLTSSEQTGSLLLHARNAKGLLRKAGAQFMHTGARVGRRADVEDILLNGPFELFEACNVISSLRYEGAAGVGHLVISDRGHPAVTVAVELMEPVNPDDYLKVRKLLAMCDQTTWLLLAGRKIYGLGSLNSRSYDTTKENLFVIRFVKHHCWELLHDEIVLMRTTYNEPRLPLPAFDPEELRGELNQRIPDIEPSAVDHLISLAETASDAKHGAMLVISSGAKGEAKRLGKQGFPLKPILLTSEQLPSIASIDGAVLLDESAICHAVGIILDGEVSKHGDPARGARFNSAIRYAQEHENCVIVVVSEDGMVNIVTKKPDPPTSEGSVDEHKRGSVGD